MTASAGVETRQTLLSGLCEARERTDELFRLLRPDAYFDRPIPERHRNIFYLGHLETFDWNLLSERILGLKSFRPEFDKLFAFGIDPVGGGLPADQPQDWPAIQEIQQYNLRVRNTIDQALRKADLSASTPRGESPLATLLNVAIEHRLMHAETFAYMLHRLPPNRKIAPALSPQTSAKPVQHQMAEIPAGEATLGLHRNGDFGWDNEFEAHRVLVAPFAIDVYEATNADFLKFMQDGGYQRRELWREDAWEWITREGTSHPAFWKRHGNGWLYQTMFGEIPLPPECPVYVGQAEAAAYAQWMRKSLPSEEEWHRAAYGTPEGGERAYPWGSETPSAKHGNFHFESWDPAPVSAHPRGASAYGVLDLLGNGWEWTSTPFSPFPGFKAFPFYPGYSANFFDGKHYVMKGGSPRTAACMLRPSFRNWFQAHYPYVYATFRCVSH
ncbi:MAG TPA: SUMF1/EgtB/PvdO family nonheme iron enzyme [Terriglobia bacterium]|nr:SUMF1/EgtB/PvdO family nonheme iron enzyme [Terriglobia bacterium]